MKRIIYILFAIMLLAATTAFAQFAKVGSSGLQFLDIQISTRAVGMGNTFMGVANDASTIFVNPAGMESIPGGEIFASYVKWPADINLNAFAGAYNLEGIGHIGVSFLMLDVGLMPIRTVYNPEGNGGTFGVEDWAVGLSFSKSLTDRFSLGATVKMVHEKLYDWEDNGWAVDVGGHYNTGYKDITLGFGVLNFGPDLQFEIDNDGDGQTDEDFKDGEDNDNDGVIDEDDEEAPIPLPISFRFGVSLPLMKTGDNSLLLSTEIAHSNDNVENYNIGAEYWYAGMIAFRAGYNTGLDAGSGFFAGAGFNLNLEGIGSAKVDYAFADKGILDYVHRASFGFSF